MGCDVGSQLVIGDRLSVCLSRHLPEVTAVDEHKLGNKAHLLDLGRRKEDPFGKNHSGDGLGRSVAAVLRLIIIVIDGVLEGAMAGQVKDAIRLRIERVQRCLRRRIALHQFHHLSIASIAQVLCNGARLRGSARQRGEVRRRAGAGRIANH